MIESYKEEVHQFGKEFNLPKVPAGVMYVFEEDGNVEGVEYLCPCGCDMVIYTPCHSPKIDRFWEFERGSNGPTLKPSVRWISGCKAHFNITDGKVIIHGDSGK